MWQLTCFLWVFIPILGWLPGVPQKLTFPWWMGICSIAAISVGLSQPIKRQVKWTGYWLFGCLVIFWIHQTQFGASAKWINATLLGIVSAHLISERGQSQWVREAVIMAAIIQFPIVCLQAMGMKLPWTTTTVPPWGSLGDRIDLGILLGCASLLTNNLTAWVFAIASALTGSWTGFVIPAMRLMAPKVRKYPLLGLLSLPAIWLFLTHGTLHLTTRFQVVSEALRWKINLMTGYGFLNFPGGFTYDDPVSQLIGLRDTHSVWLDWALRTGLLGICIGIALFLYTFKRSLKNYKYLFLFILWVGTWQSLEGRPLLALIGLIFMVLLHDSKEDVCRT